MFYSAQVLCKKGPLATIWIAAHLDRRLKRRDVFTTNITDSVENIIDPQTPLALRLSGQLLLGVVKIFSKKVSYLYDDCSSAVVKIQQVFKPANGNLLEGPDQYAEHAITLPEDLNDLEFFATDFRAFDPSSIGAAEPGLFEMGGRDTFTLPDEAASQFEAQLSMPEEQFEAVGDDMDLLLEEPERLREAPFVPTSGRKQFEERGPATPGLEEGEEQDQMIVPPDDDMLPAMPPSPLRAPSSHRSEPSQASLGDIEFASNGGVDLPEASAGGLDDLLGALPTPDPTPSDTQRGQTAQKAARKARTPAGEPGQRLKKVRLDVSEGMVATQMLGAGIRALLHNAAPLLRQRGPLQSRAADVHAAALDGEAADAPLLLPAGDIAAMAPALRRVFRQSWKGGSRPTSKGGRGRKAAARIPTPEAQHEPDMEAAPEVAAELPAADESMQQLQENLMTDGDGLPAPEELAEVGAPDAFDLPEAEPESAAEAFSAQPMDDSGPSRDGAASPDAHFSRSGQRAPTLSEASMGVSGASSQTSFTARTQAVLDHLQATFSGDTGAASKKRRRIAAQAAAPVSAVGMDSLLEGKSRQDASRWFFELLVLKSRGFVDLQQSQSFSDISITPAEQLAAH